MILDTQSVAAKDRPSMGDHHPDGRWTVRESTALDHGSLTGDATGDGLGSAAISPSAVELVAGLSSEEKARRLVAVSRDTEIGQRTLSFYLHEMHVSGDHKDFGCATALQFATDKLELARTTAQRLLQAGAELIVLSTVDQAFRRGEIRWSKVCLLCEIAVPETEERWLAFAREATVRELQREVASTEKGRAPRGNRRGLPRLSYLIQGRVDEIEHETWETARQKLAHDLGETVTNARLQTVLAEAYLRNGLGIGKGKRQPTDTLFHLALEQCPSCRETVLHKEDGPVILAEEKAEEIGKEAVIHALFDGSAPDGASRGGVEQLEPEDRGIDIDETTPAWMRKYVLVRDGYRCRSCARKRRLMVHHVMWRSKGGRSHPSNLLSLCDLCHGMVHEGKLFIEGTRETGFRFADAQGQAVGGPIRDPDTRQVVINSPVLEDREDDDARETRQGDVSCQGFAAAQRWAAGAKAMHETSSRWRGGAPPQSAT